MNNLYDFLKRHASRDAVSFHMPGHKGSDLYRRYGYGDFLDQIMAFDVTEIHGADNLFQAEGVLKQVQDKYARLYESQSSYLLVNGSSGGIMASILASVPPGGQLIMARNCHKAVFHATRLGRIQPVFVYPGIHQEFGIAGPLSPEAVEEALLAFPEARAVMVTSPNYYGITSDIRRIADLVHQSGKLLIVDEAHGAHLHFSKQLPESAVDAGADLVIHSVHKTLASFTQSSVLHRMTDRVSDADLMEQLSIIQSTSPSYLLMTSLELAAVLLEEHGDQLMGEWLDSLDEFYQQASTIPGLRFLADAGLHDRTKIDLSMQALGLDGKQLLDLLREDHQIDLELSSGNLAMAMSGIGNQREDYQRLFLALKTISQHRHPEQTSSGGIDSTPSHRPHTPDLSPWELEGLQARKTNCLLGESAGRISAGLITPYPPGIPLVCVGERITPETVAKLEQLRNQAHKVLGINAKGEVQVIDR